MQNLVSCLLLEILCEAVPNPDGTFVIGGKLFPLSHHFTVVLSELLACCLIGNTTGREGDVVNAVAFPIDQLDGTERYQGRGRKAVLVGVDAYNQINHSLCLDILSDGFCLREQLLYCFFMQHDDFPSFTDVAVVDEPSFLQFGSFQVGVVGEDSVQRDADGFFFIAQINIALADSSSRRNDVFGETLGRLFPVSFVQGNVSSFFQAVIGFARISRIYFQGMDEAVSGAQ